MEGKQIKTIRKNFGLKAVTLAKQAGVTISRLSLIENEHIKPHETELDKIEGALSELTKGSQ